MGSLHAVFYPVKHHFFFSGILLANISQNNFYSPGTAISGPIEYILKVTFVPCAICHGMTALDFALLPCLPSVKKFDYIDDIMLTSKCFIDLEKNT